MAKDQDTKYSILLIDDEKEFVEQFKDVFKETYIILDHPDISSQVFNDLRNKQPDLILLDLFLGKKDGSYKWIKQLKSENPRRPIIIITKSEDYSSIADTLRYGAEMYFLKFLMDYIKWAEHFDKSIRNSKITINLAILHVTPDQIHFDKLNIHLIALSRKYPNLIWFDSGKINGGDNISTKWEQSIANTDIFICLISADFLADHFSYNLLLSIEAKRIEKNAVVVPIKVRETTLPAFFDDLQMLPKNGIAIASQNESNVDRTLKDIIEAIETVIGEYLPSNF